MKSDPIDRPISPSGGGTRNEGRLTYSEAFKLIFQLLGLKLQLFALRVRESQLLRQRRILRLKVSNSELHRIALLRQQANLLPQHPGSSGVVDAFKGEIKPIGHAKTPSAGLIREQV